MEIPLTELEKDMLLFFMKHPNTVYTGSDLSREFGKTSRTIQKYIKNIAQIIYNHGAELQTKKGQGYQLLIHDYIAFGIFVDETIKKPTVITQTLREKFVINKLMLENRLWKIDDFSKEFFVSRTTISAIIVSLKRLLRKYHLELLVDENDCLYIEGSELEKRRFILQYLLKVEAFDSLFIQKENLFLPTETLLIIILEESRKLNFSISDFIIQNFVLHLQLTAKRIKDGFSVEAPIIDEGMLDSQSVILSNRITQRISALFGIEFTLYEIQYISLYLTSRTHAPGGMEEVESDVVVDYLKRALVSLSKRIEFSMDEQLIQGLIAHFRPLMTRAHLHTFLENPLFEEVRKRYSEELESIKAAFNQFHFFKKLELTDHEWGFIALHILAAVERKKVEKKANVLIICSTGLGSAQMVKSRIKKEFDDTIEIKDVISYYQLQDDSLEGIDFILST
ncbi:MAG: transcription antiterminator, partial [Aerococcaceae bacterium]|nr:transcription antiterminator [Aerococcaceae bacterium]